MERTNPANDQNEAQRQEEGGDSLQNNACANCKEGCVLGSNVYCSVDGRFHPLHDNLACKSFIPKNGYEARRVT